MTYLRRANPWALDRRDVHIMYNEIYDCLCSVCSKLMVVVAGSRIRLMMRQLRPRIARPALMERIHPLTHHIATNIAIEFPTTTYID